MSSADQPLPPTEPTTPPAVAEPTPTAKPPRERPAWRQGKPPSLEAEQSTKGPSIRDLDRQIEDELERAMAGISAQDMLPTEKTGPRKPADRNRTGRVVAIRGQDIFVDLAGERSQGLLPAQQFDEEPPRIGDAVEVVVERFDRNNGIWLLSRPGAAAPSVDWSSVSNGMIVEARVVSVNKGGLSVEVNGIRGFLPISQIDLYRVEQPEQFLNQKLKCQVTEVDVADKNLVVSRRALLEREREALKETLWAEIEAGQVRTGIVKGIKPFGVFVDLGGADGLVPTSEVSWQRIGDASEVVSPGQSVQVKVVKVDRDTRKILLSLRLLQNSPWDTLGDRLKPGSRITGTVSRTSEFGAFVEIEPGIEGLIHVSELSPQQIWRVTDVVREGQTVEVQVLQIDREARRISLSLKAIAAAEAAAQAATVAKSAAAAEEAAPATPAKPPKPRRTDLRGGTGAGGPLFKLPGQSE